IKAQEIPVSDTIPPKTDSAAIPAPVIDSTLRIINLNPFFTIHVDSVLQYDLKINRTPDMYYWYIKSSPIGVRIDRNTGMLYFKADKSFFKSGKLKYDEPYKVEF